MLAKVLHKKVIQFTIFSLNLCHVNIKNNGNWILILLAGLALVVLGADWLVEGSSTIARKAGLSEFVIGLTIVGIGTSTPELVVSDRSLERQRRHCGRQHSRF